jgi:hypothetical protein
MVDALKMWTVYDHPSDHPDRFVARLWLVDRKGAKATTEIITALKLKTLRESLPPGLVCLKRMPDDDPKIVEVWL